jgi:very-short-patch-repair endonuclease
MCQPAAVARGTEIPAIAHEQAGVFTAAQARADGWTARQVRRRLTSRRWKVVLGKGLTADPGPHGPLPRAWAAQLTWPGSVCSHHTAGMLHGFPLPSRGLTDVIAHRGHRPVPGICRHVTPLRRTDLQVTPTGLVVTSQRRTAIDCLAVLPLTDALDLWAWVSTRRVISRNHLVHAVHERTGRPGTPQLMHLLKLTRRGAVSGAEHLFHILLDGAGLTGWQANARVVAGDAVIAVVDVLFLKARVAIEVDGRRAHSSKRAFVTDRRRQNRLVTAGYLVLRFTWDDLTCRPDAVIEQVRAALRLHAA